MGEPTKPTIYEIDTDAEPSNCKKCGEKIWWFQSMVTGSWIPCNRDGTSHFTTCKFASSFSRGHKPKHQAVNVTMTSDEAKAIIDLVSQAAEDGHADLDTTTQAERGVRKIRSALTRAGL